MNNIYKVIWSKAKNCYVVASEIARSHTKSASGSEKIGGGTRRKLLASLMALSLLCGGLSVANAEEGTVDVQDIEATATSQKVYTAGKVDTLLANYGTKTDVENNKNSITTMNTTITTQGQSIATNVANIANNKEAIEKKIDEEKANERFATKDALNGLQNQVTNKVDDNTFEDALKLKADTDLSNLTEEGKTAIKNTMSADMEKKANKADVYSKTDADDTFATKTELNEKADATELAGKANKTDLENATNRITANEGNINNLQKKTANLSDDGKELTGMTTVRGTTVSGDNVEAGALKVTGGISDGAGVTTTLAAINDSMTQTATNKTDIAALQNKTDGQQTAIDDLKKRTTKIDYNTATDTTSVNGVKVGQQVDMGGKDITNARALTATGKVTGDGVDAGTGAITGGSLTVTGKVTGNGVDAGAGAITGGSLSVTGDTSLNKTDVGGALNVTGASDLKGDVTLGTLNGTNTVTVNGTANFNAAVNMDKGLTVKGKSDFKEAVEMDNGLTVTNGATSLKKTTVNGKLTAKENAKFEKNVTVQKDLTVDGKLNVGEIYMEHKKLDSTGPNYDSATSITADGISNLAKVTENGKTTESQFTHNEKGTFNYAKAGNTTDWKESTSNVTANGVANMMTDSDGNTHTYYQTATETREQLVNGDKSKSNFEKKTAKGNTISITEKDADGNPKSSLTNTQTVNGEKTSVTNKDSSSTIKQGADQIRYNVTSKDENTTSSSIEVKADGITNTSKDGTITNDAKDIVNNASGNISNKSQTMDTTVTGKATESYGSLDTTVNGNETHIVKGTKTETVDGKVTENYKAGQATNVTGDQDITVSGTQTTTATDINRNASSGMIDTIDNDYGTNTETKVAGETKTEVSIKGTDEKGEYIRGATQSRDYLIKGTLKNSETKTAEATSSEVTDGTNKASTIQDAKNLAGSVTNGTETGISGIHAKDGSVSIDSLVTGGGMSSVINQKKDSITSAVGDGTNSTVILQDKDNVTIASSNGTVAIGGKDIVSNAQDTITNTAGTKITDTAGDSSVVTEKGKGTTFTKTGSTTYSTEADAPTDTNIAGNLITTGRVDANELKVSDKDDHGNTADFSVEAGEGVKASASDGATTGSLDVTAEEVGSSVTDASGKGSTFKQRIDKIMMESKNVSIKAEETLTNEAKVITNKASEVINNEAININNTATGIITSKASEIKNQADKLISNKVGENTSEYIEDGKITTSVKDGAKSTVTIQNADGLQTGVTNGTSTNASATTATSSAQTIASGNKANSVITTIDGTQFVNTDAAVPVTGASGAGTAVNTTIKGNTITTGKVTMDYADVMKDLGVRGNAMVDKDMAVKGNTTLGEAGKDTTLTVNSKATFNEKAIFEQGAEVKNGLTVSSGESTFNDKVTMKNGLDVTGGVASDSFTVKGTDIKIDSSGINAGGTVISNVADGSISEGSKDAVNGGQLYQVKNDLEGKVNKVGANAAAMANLHPMEFDPDSKWNIAAAMGNYGSETATAIGAFYRPNEDVMVNFSTAFGTGENMVGGGVSVRLGKGSNKLSRQESNALKAQVNDLTARMDALLSVLNPNMSKDFPDVPENHWAYEAVSRLAGNDIVQGYPDGEFHGERTMTRYEMAEIIYNALSRGAEAEKELVEEFKPELQAMAASEKATAEKAEG